MSVNKAFALQTLKNSIDSYYQIEEQTWTLLSKICKVYHVDKQRIIYPIGTVPQSFSYVVAGLVRCFVIDDNGNEYNKNFFDEGKFPGAMASMLTSSASRLGFETIESSTLIAIDFKGYRQLMHSFPDLMRFQIAYLEHNWLLAKDNREIEIVQLNATQRYLKFTRTFPELTNRLPNYHIASHLGITPTQLSRIRRTLSSG